MVNGILDVDSTDAILTPARGFFIPPVSSITNTGTIVASDKSYGINNNNNIGNVTNAQGAGNVNGPLTYTGNLPGSYEVIINSINSYGMLAVTDVTGPMAFGIYAGGVIDSANNEIPASTLTGTTYSSVLQGFTTMNGITGTSGVFAERFSYDLVQQNTTSNWDLVVTELPYITTGSEVALSAIGVSIVPVFDGGTLLLADDDDSSIAFEVLSTGGFITAPDTGDATLSGVISGIGALTFNGVATTIISGANTYTGGTTVAAGTLKLGATGSAPIGSLTVETNGTFDLNNFAQTVTDLSGSGAITLGSATLTAGSTGDSTFSGIISGNGGLTKQGTATLTLSGANTYTGTTTVNTGTLQLGAANALTTGALTVGIDGTFDLNNFAQTVTDLSGSGAITLGSAALTAGSTGDSTFSGIISGNGGLTKQGTATLTLSGANTYSGGTNVNAGTLSILGMSPTGTGDITIALGATISGQGEIIGRLTVSGTMKPGNSPGYMSTNADVTMTSGSTYIQDIAGTTQASDSSPVGAPGYYSYLNIEGGQFIINSGATLTPRLSDLFTPGQQGYGSGDFTPLLGDRFRIITADDGIVGKFTTLNQPEALAPSTTFAVFYDMQNSKSIDLVVIPSSYTSTISNGFANQNALSVGQALDRIAQANRLGGATKSQDQLLDAIATQRSPIAVANYAQSLAGEVYAATVAVNAQTSQRVQQTVRARLWSINPSTGMGNGLDSLSATTNKTQSAEQQVGTDRHVWGDATFQRGVRSSDNNSGGWNSNLYQVTFGVDLHASESLMAGGGISLSNTTLSPAYGSATIQQGSLFAYGKMNIQKYTIDAVASLGLSSSDITRADITGLSKGFNDNSVYGKDAMLSIGLSRQFELASISVTPYAQVTWQGAIQEGINEGNSPAALSVNRFTGNNVRGVIGLATNSRGSNPSTEKYTYGAYIGIGADTNRLLNPTLSASLAQMDINITTPAAGKAFVQAGFYGTARVSSGTYVYLGLSGEARQNQTLGSVNAGIQLRF
jgi:autotransporter-associated beta strand protein